ncbi:MAG: nucleotidyl transferase AbiEii/AbiGii toxin family protein [Endomicrobium sp.]|jgi:predicted nucleotidyltransferase component of viral defense system|nr:nucleotidyl transferase AbiEii/AbiGii toxin family protein [Endomicrobium sp.]
MITADMSVKSKIKNLMKQNGINPQEAMQMYLFEKFLFKLSRSKYKNNFIFKGGCILAQLFGQSQRTTRDLDSSIKGIPLSKEELSNVINEILSIKTEDHIEFSLLSIDDIRNDETYGGFRTTICAVFGTIKENIKIDITAGDVITPKAIVFEYKMMFENKSINIMSYPVETIIAEKFETIISRGVLNTRAKDFYDIYMLVKLNKYNRSILKKAVVKTFSHRNTSLNINEVENTIMDLKTDKDIRNFWNKYQKTYKYAKKIQFDEVIESMNMLTNIIV